MYQQNLKFSRRYISVENAFSDIDYIKSIFNKYPDLFVEAFANNEKVVKTLVQKLDYGDCEDYIFLTAVIEKIGINFANEEVGTLFNVAVMEKKYELAEFLIAKGANINSKDFLGDTVVFKAIRNQNFDFFKFLVDQGADLEIKNLYDQTTLWLADSLMYLPQRNSVFSKFLENKFKNKPELLQHRYPNTFNDYNLVGSCTPTTHEDLLNNELFFFT